MLNGALRFTQTVLGPIGPSFCDLATFVGRRPQNGHGATQMALDDGHRMICTSTIYSKTQHRQVPRKVKERNRP